MNLSDSLYYFKTSDKLYLLRMYSDGTVYGMFTNLSLADIPSILNNFNKENYNPIFDKGYYKLDGFYISFQLTSEKAIATFDGMTMPNGSIHFTIKDNISNNEITRIYTKYEKSEIQINPTILSQNVIAKKEVFTTIISNKPIEKDSKTIGQKIFSFIIVSLIAITLFTCATRKRKGATCWDGSSSGATGSGACSSHKGVMYWEHKYWWE